MASTWGSSILFAASEEEAETRRLEQSMKQAERTTHQSKDFTKLSRDEEADVAMYEKYKQSKLVPVGAKEGRFESGDQRIPFDRSMIPVKKF